MDILSELNRALLPGTRGIRVNGWQGADKYPMPRDCEAIMLDSDPESDYIYMKKTDNNGVETLARYQIIEDPIPTFDPSKYVTENEFKEFREEILNGFNSLKQSITSSSGNTYSKSNGNNK